MLEARRPRWWLVRLGAGVALLGLGYGWWAAGWRAYEAEYDPTRKAIYALADEPPPEFHPAGWRNAVIWSHNAYVETFMFHDRADLDALRRFGAGFRERQGRLPPPELLVWIWDELEQASPRGQRYVTKFRADFQEQLDWARNPNGDPNRPVR